MISRSPVVGVPSALDRIAIRDAAAGFDAAPQATVRLGRQVLQVQRVEADMKLPNLVFGDSEQLDADEIQLLEDPGGILLGAAQPVQPLG